jgi:hypothetical protein
MIFERQFSNVSALAQRKKEKVCSAAKESREDRKRALRGFAFVGERSSRHVLGVVTSVRNRKVAASRMKLRPPTPNQPPEPTRLRRRFLFANAVHRVAHL